jgi:predicted alpha/beta-fold hydrolase
MALTWGGVPLPNGSLNTVLATLVASRCVPKKSTSDVFAVQLADGSQLTGEIDEPAEGPAVAHVLLVHGLGSSAHDPGVRRIALALARRGFRVYRMNHRNAGSGQGLASGIYHAGCSDDILQVLENLSKSEPSASWICVGLSLSGNMVLKMAGVVEHQARLRSCSLAGIVSVSPIVDLGASSRTMRRAAFGLFDRYFVARLKRYIESQPTLSVELKAATQFCSTLFDLDCRVVAPALGLTSVDEYYESATSRPYLESITLPTLVLAAEDDPIAPGTLACLQAAKNERIRLATTRFGGHIGFVFLNLLQARFGFTIDEPLLSFCCDLAQSTRLSDENV